jgi:hypothetical protein
VPSLFEVLGGTMHNWVTFTKRTNYPKLAYIMALLNKLGIPHIVERESFHAPILEVPEVYLDVAHRLLDQVAKVNPDGSFLTLDQVEDDDPLFSQFHIWEG